MAVYERVLLTAELDPSLASLKEACKAKKVERIQVTMTKRGSNLYNLLNEEVDWKWTLQLLEDSFTSISRF